MKRAIILALMAALLAGWTHGVIAPQVTCVFATGVATGATGPCANPLPICDGVADDTAAWLSWQAWSIAHQGSNKQINLYTPDNATCLLKPNSAQIYLTAGINDLVIKNSSYPTLTRTTIKNGTSGGSNQPLRFGGKGLYFDNLHSARFQTAAAGDSCITLITQPSTNVSAVTQAYGANAAFTASISGATMTVTAVGSGTLVAGMAVIGPGNSFGVDKTVPGSVIQPYGTGGTTGVGGTGTYILSTSQTLGSQSFTTLSPVRLTVGSTTGYTDGATVVVRGIVGDAAMTSQTNGIRWTRTIDATHLDLFQSYWGGGTYTSGGTVGGDLTTMFPVGSKVMLGSFLLQGYWYTPYGDPSNWQFFEPHTVTSVTSGAQQVCFDTLLTYAHKSTWPQFNTGDAFQSDNGGPAGIYLLHPEWETTQEFYGLTIDDPANQNVNNGRSIKFVDVTTNDSSCIAPSTNVTYTWVRVSGPNCDIEFDKLIGTIDISGSTLLKLLTQSTSVNLLKLTNTTLTKQLSGTPKKFIGNGVTTNGVGITGTTASMAFGAAAYGASTDTATCTNCVVANAISGGYVHDVNAGCMTFGATGIITIPNWCSFDSVHETQTRWAIPGANFFLQTTTFGNFALGQVIDVTQDLTNAYVATSFTSGFPFGTVTGIVAHPAPSLTITNGSGNADMVSLSGCPASLPLFSCQHRTYVNSASGTTPAATFTLWGLFSSLSMNVTSPSAGAENWSLSDFSNWTMRRVSDGASRSFGSVYAANNPRINMNVSGTRTMTQSAVTNAQSGDILTAPGEAIWATGAGNSGPKFSVNGSGETIVIEMLTDQGVVFP